MKPSAIRDLVRISRPPAPYGMRRLARTYSIEDVAGSPVGGSPPVPPGTSTTPGQTSTR